jgi:electron transfer flavoprotein alpha subunit
VLLGQSVNGPGVGAAVAARLGLGFASDVVAVQATGDELTARREILGGKVQVDPDFPANRGRPRAQGRGSAGPARAALFRP